MDLIDAGGHAVLIANNSCTDQCGDSGEGNRLFEAHIIRFAKGNK